ncbi:hypothetical protein BKA70DRAFT_1242472 [Coprinopsis sp. MPI-PUGE-AT-0042]|nr:hypothetical protein BKA70DRAFT_1242472 [Coprinopsis sp. MPI-PUGE-AT-0042]
MRLFNSVTVLASLTAFTLASTTDGPVEPRLMLLYSMEALLASEEHIVIPVVGGSFEGPRINSTIRPDAQYDILTHDGTSIFVQTEDFPLPDGRTMLKGKFETGSNATGVEEEWDECGED